MTESIRSVLVDILEDIAPRKKAIDDATCLYHDLGISGDDAAELLEKIHIAFGTSFKGFPFTCYFPNEAESIFYHFLKLLGKSSHKKRFTFRHLVDVVTLGYWVEPIKD